MLRLIISAVVGLGVVAGLILLPGWDQGAERVPPETQPRLVGEASRSAPGELPAGHPPIEGGASRPAAGQTSPYEPQSVQAEELPLKPTGSGSRAEMEKALALLDDEASRVAFEEGFRLSFTTHKEARDYTRAQAAFKRVLDKHAESAAAWRGLAYAEFNTSLSFPRTIELYEKAIELDPDYGEAHYALSFMLAAGDRERGAEHFKKAMALGVKDERNLGERFYSAAN